MGRFQLSAALGCALLAGALVLGTTGASLAAEPEECSGALQSCVDDAFAEKDACASTCKAESLACRKDCKNSGGGFLCLAGCLQGFYECRNECRTGAKTALSICGSEYQGCGSTCDDGSELKCKSLPKSCAPGEVNAVIGECWACVDPASCEGPCDDFVPPCSTDEDCDSGQVCDGLPGACLPSFCSCDPATGGILCTEDCGGKVCQEPAGDLCKDFVPPCSTDDDCDGGQVCNGIPGACLPSFCGCDSDTGEIFCTEDCGGKVCQDGGSTEPCSDFVPPCSSDDDCDSGQVCDTLPGACLPSACGCDPETGAIFCTADCGGKVCQESSSGPCADFVPPCTNDAGCPSGMECSFEGCNPSSCFCDETTGGIACTFDCGGGVCVPEEPSCGCKDDSECTKTVGGCCPCSSGGTELAVATECLDTVPGCDLPPFMIACPAVFLCTDSEAFCDTDGQCKLTSGSVSF